MGCIEGLVKIVRIPFTQLQMSIKLNRFSDFSKENIPHQKINDSILSFFLASFLSGLLEAFPCPIHTGFILVQQDIGGAGKLKQSI